jgi:hypothetical protein
VASWYEAEVKVRFLLAFALCAWPALAQSDQDGGSNMSCVERLQMPVYPPLARLARISGSVTATVIMSTEGSIQVTSSQSAHPLVTQAVENALHGSAFSRACVHKPIQLVFNFVFDEKSNPGRTSPQVSFGYPNQFWISVPLPQVMP